jgi:hypothetical protein
MLRWWPPPPPAPSGNVSYSTAAVLLCTHNTIIIDPLSREKMVDVVRCATSLGLYTPMMMIMIMMVVVVTTETCWNMD